MFLEDAQWVISRKTGNGHTASFAAKGGHNDEPHNHNDLGSFMFSVDEEVFLCDLGGGLYTRQYFSEERYNMLVTGSQGHSVPIVNGNYQKEGKAFAAQQVSAVLNEEKVIFSADLTKAYPECDLESLNRKLTFVKGKIPSLVLQDTATFQNEICPFTERLITKYPVTVKENTATIHGKKGDVILKSNIGVFTVSKTSYTRKANEPDVEVNLLDISLNPQDAQKKIGRERTWEISISADYQAKK